MIVLSRLNGDKFVLNAYFIETIEETPDTVISLTSGKKLMVKDKAEDVVKRVIEYKRMCNATVTVVKREINGTEKSVSL
jgi:flagellar protein FlbD